MRTIGLSIAFLFASALPAQLLKNINTLPAGSSQNPVDSNPQGFVAVGGRVYFTATTGPTGYEYFWVDGSGGPAQLLADIAPGSDGSHPRNLVALPNGLLLFTATNQAVGEEVWVSDGTAAGTSVLIDLTGPGGYTGPRALTVHQGMGYFLARSTGNSAPALWRTDGTTAGTVQIEDLGAVGADGNGGLMASAGGQLLYTAASSVAVGGVLQPAWRLYTTDGTVGGAQLVTEELEDSRYGTRELTAAGSRVVFVAQGIGTGLEPWVSDGTAAGTGIVDLIPGSDGSNPSELTVVGNQVFFAAYEAFITGEIFVSDGTVVGTVQVTSSTRQFSRPLHLNAVGNQLAYGADDGVNGFELWTTSATPGSETLFADLVPGSGSSYVTDMVAVQGGILCAANTPATGHELFFSDGTPAGTGLVRDLAVGPDGSNPQGLTALGSQVFFGAKTLQFGHELWVSDASFVGTQLHTDLAPTIADQGSHPQAFTSIGNRAVFAANDGITGKELWSTDGTTAGTMRLTDFNGSSGSIDSGPREIFRLNGRAILSLDDGVHGFEPWITDGTTVGTQMLADLNPGFAGSNPWPMCVWNDELYFAAGPFGPRSLYATDGTTAGTRLVKRFAGSLTWVYVDTPVAHAGRLYFAARTAAEGVELWSTDGTTAGTAIVVDIVPGPQSGLQGFEGASLGGHLYFSASDTGSDHELWRTDGTAAGTGLFRDLNPSSGSWPGDFHTIGQRIVFSAYVNGEWEYNSTDGVTVAQLSFPPLYIHGWTLYSIGDQLIGMLRGANGSFNLWGTDGTAAGSGVIKQIHPDGTEFVNLRAWRVSSGSKLLFAAGNSTVGSEIFVTDGTTAGTDVFVDLVPGPHSSHVDEVVQMGDSLIFGASGVGIGYELFSLPWTQVGDWLAEPYGVGCEASGNLPSIGASGAAQTGSTLTLEVRDAPPVVPILHYWSDSYSRLNLGACSVYLAAPTFGALTASDAAGASSLPIAIPNNPSLVGAGLWLQSLAVEAGGEFLGIGALTPALEVRIGG